MIKLYDWNVNGIRAVIRKGALQEFLKKHQPDVLCMQETKAQPSQVDHEFDGYHAYWSSADKAGYSGTCILSRIEPIQVIDGFPDSVAKKFNFIDDKTRDSAREGRLQTAEFENFYLINDYSINAKDDLTRLDLVANHWHPAVLALMKQLEKTKPVILTGDLNVAHTEDDLANPKPNRGKKGFTDEERAAFQKYLDAGYEDVFRKFHQGNGFYTWWSHWANSRARNVGWRIDYFLVSKKLSGKVKSAEIHADVMGSDHCPISLKLEI